MIAWLVAALAVALLAATFGLPLLLRRRDVEALRRTCRSHGLLALSYDDGPGPRLTSQLLDRLAASGARASFFPLGARIDAATQVLDRLRAEGHEVGCHSMSHLNAWRTSPLGSVRDLRAGFDRLAPWLSPSRLFRPPHGKLTLFTWWAMRSCGARAAWWTIDSGDTWAELPPVDDVVARVEREGGGVVLLHDFERSGERAGFVLEVTERLLELARQRQLEIRPLGEILPIAEPRGDA